MRAELTSAGVRVRPLRRSAGFRLAQRGLLAALATTTLGLAVVWLAFAGSAARLADGVVIAGVEVGGLTPEQARGLLAAKTVELAAEPVAFTAGDEVWRITPDQLGVKVDWAAAVEAARRQGSGFGPVRGLRRLQTRFFGAEISPPIRVYDAALVYHVDRFAEAVDQRPREAALVLRGLTPAIVPPQTGRKLDQEAAERTIVRALSSFSRAPVGLPVRVDPPRVTSADLRPVAAQARTALSAPVRLALGRTRWRLPRWRIAHLLSLPRNGSTALAIGGPAADRYFEKLGERVARPPVDARFEASEDGAVHVVPGRPGSELDAAATAEALLVAALTPTRRLAEVVVAAAEPELSTAEAESLGITRVLATYTTPYAGSADRIHNLQLAVSLLDGALVAPGATFSLNARVGERTLERGFRPAPVIINGEYEDDVGGGVSQVATTVFNAAWEAGLKITERAAHALYISRYPLGRDATLNFPDLDLKFQNDTEHPIYVRAGAGGGGIFVSLYGAPTGRRVESTAGPLRVVGPAPVERVDDPTLFRGETEVEEEGSPARSVSVTRTVYDEDGDVLYDETWSTSYRGEKRIIRVGTKPKPPEPKADPPEEKKSPKEPQPPVATTPTPTVPAVPPVPAP